MEPLSVSPSAGSLIRWPRRETDGEGIPAMPVQHSSLSVIDAHTPG